MINLVEFQRVPSHEIVNGGAGRVYIAPDHVVKVERFDLEGFASLITLVNAAPEPVEGAPSEVIQRLRKGA